MSWQDRAGGCRGPRPAYTASEAISLGLASAGLRCERFQEDFKTLVLSPPRARGPGILRRHQLTPSRQVSSAGSGPGKGQHRPAPKSPLPRPAQATRATGQKVEGGLRARPRNSASASCCRGRSLEARPVLVQRRPVCKGSAQVPGKEPASSEAETTDEHRVPTSPGHISNTGIHLARRHPGSNSSEPPDKGRGCAYRGQFVKLAEELIEEFHQLLGRALRRQAREAHDVREEDAAGQRGASCPPPPTDGRAPATQTDVTFARHLKLEPPADSSSSGKGRLCCSRVTGEETEAGRSRGTLWS